MPAKTLPVELWLKIFKFAVYVPLLLSNEWDYLPQHRFWQGWEPVDDTEIETKRSIVQVCRLWNELGVQLLYESISILYAEDYHQVGNLIKILRRSESTSQPGYGYWIK